MSYISFKIYQLLNRSLCILITIFLMLSVLSGVLLSVRLTDYIKIEGKEVQLTSDLDTEFDLFSVQYESGSGEITVSGADGTNVIAPGTSAEYTIHLKNVDEAAIDYRMIPKITFASDLSLPILIRMTDGQGAYIIGDADRWASVKDIARFTETGTLYRGESAKYRFEWKWEFEARNDQYDTLLGSEANRKDVGVKVNFTVLTEAGAEPGKVKPTLGYIVGVGAAFFVLFSFGVYTAVILARRYRNEIL